MMDNTFQVENSRRQKDLDIRLNSSTFRTSTCRSKGFNQILRSEASSNNLLEMSMYGSLGKNTAMLIIQEVLK